MIKKKQKNNKGSKKPYAYGIILIAIIFIALFLFYKENQVGTLIINANDKAVDVFIDEKDNGSFDLENNKSFNIKKGSHSIVLSKEGYWPWTKEISIEKQQIINIYPFFVPRDTSGFIIPETDPEYNDIILLFNTRKTHIDWEKNENTPMEILTFEAEIKASDFYKDRNDVIIVAVQNGIYALEINSNSVPNFQPIYKGPNPTFTKKDNDTLYIKDGEMLMEVAY